MYRATLITYFYISTTSALSCFDALAKEEKHTCTAYCFHSELVTIPAKLRSNIIHFQITKEETIPLTTLLVWVSSSGSKVAKYTASYINTMRCRGVARGDSGGSDEPPF